MTKSSLPESSPFTTTDLPMVATSWLRKFSLRIVSGGRGGALTAGLWAEPDGPGWGTGVVSSSSFRFHILLSSTRSRRRPAGVRSAPHWERLNRLHEHTQPQAWPQTILPTKLQNTITFGRLSRGLDRACEVRLAVT